MKKMKNLSIKRVVTLMLAFVVCISSVVISTPQTTQAATAAKKNCIELVTAAGMKGKSYSDKNMQLNKVTALTTYKGQKTTLVPVYVYQDGKLKGSGKNCVSYRGLKYTSSRTSVATVSKKGVITPKKNGTTTITVRSIYNSKVKGTIKVTVTTKKKAVTATRKEAAKGKFVLEASNGKTWMYKGEYITLSIKYSQKMKSKKLTFKSSDKSIATVNSKGVVTAKKKGNVTITATSKSDKSVKATFDIVVKTVPSTMGYDIEYVQKTSKDIITFGGGITPTYKDDVHIYMNYQDWDRVTGDPIGEKYDQKICFAVKKVWGASSNEIASWTNSNPDVAELTADHILIPKKKGTTVVTVQSAVNKNLKDIYTVTVYDCDNR